MLWILINGIIKERLASPIESGHISSCHNERGSLVPFTIEHLWFPDHYVFPRLIGSYGFIPNPKDNWFPDCSTFNQLKLSINLSVRLYL